MVTEDLLPIILHADDGPAILLRVVVERGRESTAQFCVRNPAIQQNLQGIR
jgi:hypothetical protein